MKGIIREEMIIPDLYSGLGDGAQEIDFSSLQSSKNYTKGIREEYQQRAHRIIEKLEDLLADPNEIQWEGKRVFIDAMCDNQFRVKLCEMGAFPLWSDYSSMDYYVLNLDFRTYLKRDPEGKEEWYIQDLEDIYEQIKSIDKARIIEERDFIKWCINGHEVLYDLKKNEHLEPFRITKIPFNRIDPVKFIKEAIVKNAPGQYQYRRDHEKRITADCCVVGAGSQAKKIRRFYRDVGKEVIDEYTEGARCSKLILENPDGEDEKRAATIAGYNRACCERVQIWSAEEVLSLIDLYSSGIKEAAGKKIYDNRVLNHIAKQIIDSAQTGSHISLVAAERDVESAQDKAAQIVKDAIITVESIDFEGKTFVLYGHWTIDGVYYANTDMNHPVIKGIQERGGIVRDKITGKTDYFVIQLYDGFWGKYMVREAAKQLEKRDTLTVIVLSNLREIMHV